MRIVFGARAYSAHDVNRRIIGTASAMTAAFQEVLAYLAAHPDEIQDKIKANAAFYMDLKSIEFAYDMRNHEEAERQAKALGIEYED